jgi:hypothetical protein
MLALMGVSRLLGKNVPFCGAAVYARRRDSQFKEVETRSHEATKTRSGRRRSSACFVTVVTSCLNLLFLN